MNLVIIRYPAGNIQSVSFALERLGVDAQVSDDPEIIRRADKIIFPGVGEASTTMAFLREQKLDELIVSLKQPVLGICLGMQLMCAHSEEGNVKTLGIFPQQVKRFQEIEGAKIPHMGWNTITQMQGPLFKHVQKNASVYFVHSYYATLGAQTTAVCDYITPFSAALSKDNFHAVQFHPEKSGLAGEQILENFLNL